MSYNNKNVPVIAITPDEGSNDFEATNNIDEVATDVEDIYFQNEKRKKKSKRYNNMKKDVYATDVEDMEGSDDDIASPIVKHSAPLSLNDMILAEETPIVEESYKSNLKKPRAKPKLKSQTSVTASKHFLELDDMDSYQVLTDCEDFDASDEDDEASDSSDTDLLKEIIHDSGSIAISDSVKKFLQAVPSPMITPDFSENESQKKSNSKSLRTKKSCRHYISPSSISPHLSDITDTEMIHYDSNDETKICKLKHKYGSKGRRHTIPHKYKPDTTDSDRDISENELTKLRRVTVADLGETSVEKLRLNSSPNRSLNADVSLNTCNMPLTIHEIESDEEDNADLYPVKKNFTKKPSNTLKVEKNPDEGITDTEDMEGDVPENTYSYDENVVNFNDFETSDGVIQEKMSVKLSKNLNKLAETRIYTSKQDDSNEASTDEEEDIMAGDRDDDKVEITEDINIKFIRHKKITVSGKSKQKDKVPLNNLCIPKSMTEDALTDVENLNSSDDESQNETEIPITIANNESVDNETDSESLDGELQKQFGKEVDESFIPPVSRKVIRQIETEDNNLKVISTNIYDEDFESDIVNNKTDIEDFSGDECDEEIIPVQQTDVPFEFGDVEKVDHKDSLKLPNSHDNDEAETDIEDIDNLKKPTRSKRSKRFLYVDNDDTDKLTDVEDIILSDKEKSGNYDYLEITPLDNAASSKTDVEDFDASDNEQERAVPEYCRTPDIMRQMGGETVCSQEGSGHFTKQDMKKLNEKHRSFSIPEVSPSPTLTDEFMTSADDEVYTRTETVTPSQMTQALDEASVHNIHSQSSKKMDFEADEEVMYLKGGGFLPEAITDTEEMGISDEEYFLAHEKQDDTKNKVLPDIETEQNQQMVKLNAEDTMSASWLQDNISEQSGSQEWGPAKGTSSAGDGVGEKPARDAALKGNTTSPSIVIRNEDKIKLVTSDSLSHDIKSSDIKPIVDETVNACVSNTDPGQQTIKSPDQDKAIKELDNKKEKSKSKGGFFSSLKSLVGRSFDSSDSESKEEKTPKKKKKKEKGTPKKDKKSKEDKTDDTPTKSGKPSSPIVQEKPKALYESNALDNIPAIDETEIITIQVTDLDADPVTTDEVKIQATTIVDNVIKDSKKAASHIMHDRIQEFNLEGTVTPEEVRRSREPIIINEDEFLVVIEPKLNDDYEDIQSPDELLNQKESTISPKVDETESKSDTLKSRRSTGFMKLFSKKDSKESDDESRGEDLKQSADKQDHKPEKHEEHRKSTGFFGLFHKKSKDDEKKEECKDIILKEEPGIEYSKEGVEFSKEVQQQMVDTANFLISEIEYFEDVRPNIEKNSTTVEELTSVTNVQNNTQQKMIESADFLLNEVQFFEDVRPQSIIKEQVTKTTCNLAEQTLNLSPIVQQQMVESAHFLRKEIELFEDVRPKIESEKIDKLEDVSKSKVIEFSPEVQQQMVDTVDFLLKEVEFFEDVKPIDPKPTEQDKSKVKTVTTENSGKSKETTEKTVISVEIKKDTDATKDPDIEQTDAKQQSFFSKLGFGSKSVDKKDEVKDKKKQKKKKERKPGFFTKFGEKFSSSSQEDKNYLSSDDDSKTNKLDEKDKKVQTDRKSGVDILKINIESKAADSVNNITEDIDEFKERSVTIIGKIMDTHDEEKESIKNFGQQDIIDEHIQSSKDISQKTSDETSGFFTNLNVNIEDNANKVKENIKHAAIISKDTITTKTEHTRDTINDTVEAAKESVKATKDRTGEKIKETEQNVEDFTKESVAEIKESTKETKIKLEESVDKQIEKVIDITESAKDATKDVVEKSGGFFSNLGKKVKKTSTDTKDSLESTTASAKNKVVDTTEQVKDSLQNIADKTNISLSNASENLNDMGHAAKDKVIDTKETSNEKIKSTGEKVENSTKESVDKITESVQETKTELAEQISSTAKDVKDKAEKTSGFFSSFGKKAKKAGKDTKEEMEATTVTSTDKAKEETDSIKKEIKDTAEKTQTFLNDTDMKITDSAVDIKKSLIVSKDASIEKVKEGLEKLEDITKESTERIIGTVDATKKDIAEPMNEQTEYVSALVDDAELTAKETAEKSGGFFSNLGKKVNKSGKEMKEEIESAADSSKSKTKESAVNLKIASVETVNETVEKSGGFFSSLGKKIKKSSREAKEEIESTVITAQDKVVESHDCIKDTADKVHGSLSNTGEKIKDSVIDAKDHLIAVKDTSVEKVKDGVEKMDDFTKESAAKVSESAAESKNELVESIDKSTGKLSAVAEDTEAVSKDTAEKTGGFFSSLGKKTKKAGKDVKEELESTAEISKHQVKENTKHIKEGIKITAEQAQDSLSNAGVKIKTSVQVANENLIATKDTSIEKIKDDAEKVEDFTEESAIQISESVTEGKNKLAEPVCKGIGKISTVVEDTKAAIKETTEITGEFFGNLGKETKKVEMDAKEGLESAAETSKDKVKESTENIKEEIKDTVEKSQGSLSNAGDKTKASIEDTKDTLIATKDTSLDKIKGGVEKVEDFSKMSAAKIPESAEESKNKLTESVSKGIEKVSTVIEDRKVAVKETAEKTGGFFSSLGKKAKKAKKDAKEEFESTAEASKIKVKESTDSIKEGVKDTVDKTQDFFTRSGEKVQDSIEDAKDNLISAKDISIEKVKNGAEKVEDFTKESVVKISESAAESKNKLAESVDTGMEKVSTAAEDTKADVKDTVEKTGGFFSNFGKKAKKVGKEAKEELESTAETKKDKIEESIDNIKEGVYKTAGEAQDSLSNVGQKTKAKVEDAKDNLFAAKDTSVEKLKGSVDKVEDITLKISDSAADSTNKLAESLDRGMEKVSTVAGDTKAAVTETAEKTGGFFSNLGKKAKKVEKDTKERLESTAETSKDKVKDGTENIKEKIKDTAENAQDSLSNVVEKTKDSVEVAKDTLIATKDTSVNKMKDCVENVEDFSKTSAAKMSDSAVEIKNKLTESVDKSIEKVSTAAEDTKATAKDTAEKTGGFFSSLGKKAKKAGKDAKEGLESTVETGKHSVKEDTDNIKDGVKDTAEKAQHTLSYAGEKIKTSVDDAKDNLIAAKDTSIENVKSGFEKIEDFTKESATETKNKLAESVDRGMEEVSGVAEDTKVVIKETSEKTGGFFSNFGKKAKKAGKDVKEGLESAAEISKDQVKEGTKNIKEGVKDTAEKAQDSLSKVGEKITDSAEDAKDILISTKDTSVNKIKDGVEKVEDFSKSSAAKISDSAVESKNKLTESVDIGIKKVDIVAKDTREAVKDTAEKTGGFFSNLGKKVKKTGKDAKEEIESTAEVSNNKIKAGTYNIKEEIKDTAEQTEDSLSNASEKIKTSVDDAQDMLISAKDTSVEKIKSGVEKVGDLTKESAEKISESTVETKNKLAESVDKGIEKVSTIAEDTKAAVKETTEKTGGFFSNLGKKAKKAGKDVKEGLESTAEIRKDQIKEGTKNIKEGIKDTSGKAQDSLSETGEKITHSVEDIKDNLIAVKDTSLEKMKGGVDEVKDFTKETTARISESIVESKNKLTESSDKCIGVSTIAEDTKASAESTAEKTEGFFSNISKKAKKAGKDAKEELESAAITSKDKVRKETEQLKGELEVSCDKANIFLSKTGEKVKDSTCDVLDKLSAAKDTSIDKSKDTIEKIKEFTKDSAEKTGEFCNNLDDKAKTSAADVTECVESATIATKDDVANAIEDELMNVTDKTQAFVSSTTKNITDSVDGTKSKAIATKDEKNKNIVEDLEHYKNESANKLLETTIDAKVILTETVDKTVEKVGNIAVGTKDVVHNKKEEIKDATNKVKSTLSESGDKIKDFAEETKDKVIIAKDTGAGKMKGTVEKVEDFANETSTKFVETANEMKQDIAKSVDQKVETTSNLAEETKDAIKDTGEKTGGFFSNLGKKAKKAGKDAKQEIESVAVSTKTKFEESTEHAINKVKDTADKTSENIIKSVEESKDSAATTKQAAVEKGKDTIEKVEDITKEAVDKTGGFFSNLGKKAKKTGESAKDELESVAVASKETVNVVRKETDEFLKCIRKESEKVKDDTVKDSISEAKKDAVESTGSLIEQDKKNVDELNKNIDNQKTDFICYVTTPKMQRKGFGGSQRIGKDNRPPLLDVSNMPIDSSSDEDEYIVTEPNERFYEDSISSRGSPIVIETIQECDELEKETTTTLGVDTKRKPLFHIGSRDEESISESVDLGEKIDALSMQLDTSQVESDINLIKSDAKSDIDLIEDKLLQLGKALDDLEKVNIELEPQDSITDEKSERKLRRVERRFERMASETMEKDIKEAKEQQMTSPEVEAKREEDFRTIVSQLSQEEVSECQKLYSTLWDDSTFTPSEEWDSKTPDSQPDDIQELPQGVLDTESDQDADKDDSESRPQSRISKTDSEVERGMSTAISEDKDSELIALMNQGSMDVFSEPIERPLTPEPLLESRGSIEGIPSLPTTPKSKICGSEKSSIEEGEAEAAFSMVAHISPAHKAKGDICPIMEDEDAEKHELETRERAQKELEKRRAQILRDQSPGNIPDIMVTEHMTPLVDREFHYPDLELEEKEALAKSAPQTPASISSKSSEDTDQGREYILDDTHQAIPEEPETENAQEDKQMTESKSEMSQSTTVEERTVYEPEPKEHESLADSPNSDSFEMLEQPDIIDDFVVIEEVAKEAAEHDEEGKSVKITQTKYIRKHDEEVEEYLVKSAPTPLTRMTELKYYPEGASSGDELGPFDFEDSPPQAGKKSTGVKTVKAESNVAQSYGFEYDRELEASKKWIEMQFQGDPTAMINAGYGYEMEFERGPLEDIKEEEATDFESSRIGSLDSQKHSVGSIGSVKDSFSSTPEYDVLAGRKFFTRSGEHDDVSMSSLQEFEQLERVISLENRRHQQGSQDSSSNGSFSKRYQAGRSGQGDDVSMSSLKEFEGLETACIEAHKIEVKANEEEALLGQIDEAQENLISESESCKSPSNADKKTLPESEEEDYEKRMFEIDEIIKQAQSNVEKFIDMKDIVDKTESMGRGDSLEEVAKVPDLDLDEPLVKSTVHTVKWGTDDIMQTSTDSLDQKVEHRTSVDSLDMKPNADLMTASTDSIEFQLQSKANKDNLMTDSIDIPDPDRSYMITSDSLELTPGSLMQLGQMSDSIDEDGSRIGAIGHDQSSSSGFSMSKDEQDIHDQRAEYLLGSTDSLDRTSSTATHATYQYETDSVMSGSFTSGGSNTMVSSTDTIDPMGAQAHGVDLASAVRKVWFDEDAFGTGSHFTTELLDDGSKPYVTEVIEPCEGDPDYSHTIHRKVQLPPEIKKITFKGPDADLQLRQYIENFGEGEDVHETQETDKDGNIHVKRVVQKRFVVKSDPSGEETRISGPELESYLQHVTHSGDEFDLSYKDPTEFGLTKQTRTDSDGTKIIYGQKFSAQHIEGQGEESALKQLLSSIASDVTQSTTYAEQNLTRHVDKQQEQQSGSSSTTFSGVAAPNLLRAQGSRRKPLRFDISVDDQTEVDPREHDWRFNLPRHDEATTDGKLDESESAEATAQQRSVADQHHLSSEMKDLLEEMEKQSKQ